MKTSKKFPWFMIIKITAFIIIVFIYFSSIPAELAKIQNSSFSFIVFGDTRTELFIPYEKDSIEYIKRNLAARYIGKNAKIFFNKNGKLDSVWLLKDEKMEEILIYKQQSFPQEVFRIINEKRRRAQYHKGAEWVYSQIADDINNNISDFAIHGGDIVLFGYQGNTFKTSPYWQYFNESFYKNLPEESLFPVVGNHETWYDSLIIGMREAFPYLTKYGFTDSNRIYTRNYKNCKFVYLYSGTYAPETVWNSKEPDFSTQMDSLKKQLKDALLNNIKNVFVTYHFPSFVKVGHTPLPKDQNPHEVLKNYSDTLNIIVFNSHTHTTEYYFIDNIHYLVMGAGGAPQKYTEIEGGSPEKELYWNGKSRYEEYNYLKVEVDENRITGKIHRFIPPEKYEWVDIFEIIL